MIPHTEDSELSPHVFHALLVGGDWACAHGDPEGLMQVAERLSTFCSERLRAELAEVERLAATDMLAASARWLETSARVRAELLTAMR